MPHLNLGTFGRKKRLNIAAIPNCEWWVDLARPETITFASGSNVSQVADLSGKNRHLTKTGAGNETIYPTYVANERGLSFLSASMDQMIAGASGNWNFMHNGAGCSVLILVKIDSAQASNAVIFSTASESGTGIGLNLWYFNPNQNYNVVARNGVSQTLYSLGATGSMTKNTNVILSLHNEFKTGNPPDLVTRYNGLTDVKAGNLTTYSTSNSTGPLTIGKLPDANFKCRMIFKKCAIFSRRLTKAEENRILEAWAAEENITLTQYGERYLAVIAGQDNATGRGLIAGSAFQASPQVATARIFNNSGFSWATLEAGVNNAAYSSSHLGFEMNLAKQFSVLGNKDLNVVKQTADNLTLNSWIISNPNFQNLQLALRRAHWSLEDDGYVSKPFLVWYQGENDAQNATDAGLYQTRLQDFMTNIMATPGFAQMPTYIVRIHQAPFYTDSQTVRDAQLTTTVTTPYSAYSHLIEIDDIATHASQNILDADGLNALGERLTRRVLGL